MDITSFTNYFMDAETKLIKPSKGNFIQKKNNNNEKKYC